MNSVKMKTNDTDKRCLERDEDEAEVLMSVSQKGKVLEEFMDGETRRRKTQPEVIGVKKWRV